MKDKLYKNKHKGKYYRSRKAIFVFVAVASAFTAVSIPTYINLNYRAPVKAENSQKVYGRPSNVKHISGALQSVNEKTFY